MRYIIFILGILISLPSWGQGEYPPNYFQSPLNIPLQLAGNFGEFRPNHFHTGLDFKTQQVENLPVFAAAEGFVSRISISHSGYGNCLHVRHPNGFTTVYAHLNSFDMRIAQYVLQQQLQQEKWNIDINIDTPILAYDKGAQIALSGNTGGSVAPHLHFEIRNTETQHVVNGMHFAFDIADKTPPIVRQVGFYNAQLSVYQQTPLVKSLIKKDNNYTLNGVSVLPYIQLKLGVIADDYMDQSTNNLGVYQVMMKVDGKMVFETKVDELNFAHNKSINGYTDFKYRSQKKQWMQLLFRSANNHLSFYKVLENNATIDLSDQTAKNIELVLLDYDGNESIVNFTVQYDATLENKTLVVQNEFDVVNQPRIWSNTYYKFLSDGYAFYDQLVFQPVLGEQKQWSYGLQLHDQSIPLAQPQELYLKLLHPIPFKWHSKLVFRHEVKAQSLPGAQAQKGMKASFKEGFAFAKVKTLGYYYADIDTVAPVITIKQNNAKGIVVQVTEETTSIQQFKAFLDGKFVVFSRKGNVFTSDLTSFTAQSGNLEIVVQDENANEKRTTISVKLT